MFASVLTGYGRLCWCPHKPPDPRYAPACGPKDTMIILRYAVINKFYVNVNLSQPPDLFCVYVHGPLPDRKERKNARSMLVRENLQ